MKKLILTALFILLATVSYARELGVTSLRQLKDVNTATATSGNMLVADGTDWESVLLTGDCTITASGTIDCSAAAGANNLVELGDVNSSTATAGRILVT